MSCRRDNITGEERAQIALQCLASQGRRDGKRQELAAKYNLSRQSIHRMEQQARAALAEILKPKAHGPVAKVREVMVTPEHVQRSVLVLAGSAVSERGIQACLEQILGCKPSLGSINATLRRLGQRAAEVNASWQPAINEGLAADEIYCQGVPNLLVVGSESLYIYALTKQDMRDGETWACVLWDTPTTGQLARDGGTGLRAGASLTGRPEQLDWWHVLRDVWRIDASLERRAYGVLHELFARETSFDEAHTTKRLTQHLMGWEKLSQQANEAMQDHDRYHTLARTVDDLFGMIDLATGALLDGPTVLERMKVLGKQIHDLEGRACSTLGTTLEAQAPYLFAYLPRLRSALAPIQAHWGQEAVAGLCRIWQVEEQCRRRQLCSADRQQLNAIWQTAFEATARLLGDDLFEAWEDVQALLGLNWRGSNAAECVNSLLRPHFNAQRSTSQNALDLRRFLHNTRTFARGKRAGHSPAQLVGIELPSDPLTLLGLPERRLM